MPLSCLQLSHLLSSLCVRRADKHLNNASCFDSILCPGALCQTGDIAKGVMHGSGKNTGMKAKVAIKTMKEGCEDQLKETLEVVALGNC